jgi:hypothetical protein
MLEATSDGDEISISDDGVVGATGVSEGKGADAGTRVGGDDAGGAVGDSVVPSGAPQAPTGLSAGVVPGSCNTKSAEAACTTELTQSHSLSQVHCGSGARPASPPHCGFPVSTCMLELDPARPSLAASQATCSGHKAISSALFQRGVTGHSHHVDDATWAPVIW